MTCNLRHPMGLRHPVVEKAKRKLQNIKRLYSVSSDFSRFEWESLAIIRVSEYIKRENVRFVAPSKCCKPFPLHASSARVVRTRVSYDSEPPCLPVATSLGSRPIECLLLIGNFPQKSPILSCSFAKKDLQLKSYA